MSALSLTRTASAARDRIDATSRRRLFDPLDLSFEIRRELHTISSALALKDPYGMIRSGLLTIAPGVLRVLARQARPANFGRDDLFRAFQFRSDGRRRRNKHRQQDRACQTVSTELTGFPRHVASDLVASGYG
jgi:hypothetical protein